MRLTETEEAILRTLVQLEERAKSMATAQPKPDLLPLFKRLDELERQLAPGTPPQLLHYLRQKSYQKARLLLEGKDAENARGNCGR